MYIHSFRLIAPRKLLEAQLFNQQYQNYEDMLLQLPGENFLQAEIGVVFPLSTGPIFSVKSNCHNCQEC